MTESFGSPIRKQLLFIFILTYSILLVFQLLQMQIFRHGKYEEKAQTNSVKGFEIEPPRGIFYDRNFNVLISNKPSYTFEIIPAKYKKDLTPILENVLNVDSGYVERILKKNKRFSPFLARKIKRNLDFKTIAWFEENSEKLPGVNYKVEEQRDYSYGIMGSHIFGYLKEVSKSLLDNDKYYSIGDYAGFKGLEKKYERILRGKKGKKFLVIDAKQKVKGKYENGEADIKPEKGKDIILTIDKDLQEYAESLFVGKTGSLIAIEPSSGEILSYVSSPNYDLSNFASLTSDSIWKQLQSDPKKPLFNRPIMSINPPGSTFKMVLAMAALEEGIITENTKFHCAGGYQFGNRFFKCHGGVHGKINVIKAIEESCNSFFYQLILKVGLEKWHYYADKFGFGKHTNIDLDNEYRGILPSAKYYNRVYGKKKWTKGLLLNLSIGQGELSVTPMQLAKYVSLIANNGKSFQPHLAKGILDIKNKKIIPLNFKPINLNIKQHTFDVVKKGMYNVVNADDGTAHWYKLKDIKFAGKTGTAQNPHGKDHAWFIAFAPYKNPQIAVVVMVENVGFGSTYAAPIARDLIKKYLTNRKNITAKQFLQSLK